MTYINRSIDSEFRFKNYFQMISALTKSFNKIIIDTSLPRNGKVHKMRYAIAVTKIT